MITSAVQKRSLLIGLALTLVTVFILFSILSSVRAQAGEFDRRAMLTSLSENVILPCHEQFVASADDLATHVQSFYDSQDVANLQQARAAWLETALTWQKCELFSLAGFETMILHNRISKMPRTNLIEDLLASSKDITAESLSGEGSTVKGVGAIEYILFQETAPEDVLNILQNDARRLNYLLALSQNLAIEARGLRDFWLPEGGDYTSRFVVAEDASSSIKDSLNILVNELIANLEQLARDELGAPLGNDNGGEPQPELALGYLSGSSLQLTRSKLEGIQLALYNDQADGQLGLDDYLNFLTADDQLANQLANGFAVAFEAIDVVDIPLAQAVYEKPAKVEAVYEAVRELVVLTKVDMANQLGITVTFSDSDGD
ncbi:MAG: imelysin family protein [Deinococcota bacterium]